MWATLTRGLTVGTSAFESLYRGEYITSTLLLLKYYYPNDTAPKFLKLTPDLFIWQESLRHAFSHWYLSIGIRKPLGYRLKSISSFAPKLWHNAIFNFLSLGIKMHTAKLLPMYLQL